MRWPWDKQAQQNRTPETGELEVHGRKAGPVRTGLNRRGTSTAVVGFYGAFLAVAAVAFTALGSSMAAEDDQPVVAQTANTTAAESLAQNYVASWLSASRDDHHLVESVAGSALSVAPEEPLQFDDLTVAEVSEPDEAGMVAVTISAIVTEPVSAEEQDDGEQVPSEVLRYYQVAVTQDDDALAVVGYPTPVSGPNQAESVSLAYPETINARTALGQAVAGFLQSYAAGGGDASRYTAPGTTLDAITPAPYQDIKITQIRTDLEDEASAADGQQAKVLVDAEAVLPASTSSRQAVTWALTLQARTGRWEITSIDSVPVISAPEQPTAQQ